MTRRCMTGTLLALALACAGPAIGGCAGVVADAGPGAQRPPQHPHAPQRPAPGDAAVAEGEEEEDVETEAQMFRTIEDVFGRKGEVRDGVYRLVTPRSDLFVTMEGMDVPTGAFIESDFRFWHCPCGKLLVNGQFALADHEVNDVVDELHEGRLHVVAIAPLLLHEHPRLLMVRFQAEGRSRAIAEALRSALSYTGEERNRAQPIDIAPAREE